MYSFYFYYPFDLHSFIHSWISLISLFCLMNASTLTIHWHNDTQPIYAVDFQPGTDRLATAGGDNNVRMWSLNAAEVRYLSTLRKHTQAVNVVRFSPDGSLLASAGDDGTLMLWKLLPTIIRNFEEEEDDDPLESWLCVAQIRSSTSEINDIAWSPDGHNILTGSMDNCARIYRITAVLPQKWTGTLVTTLTEHSHYVQGVCWDPMGEYVATQSADRTVNIHNTTTFALVHRFMRHDGYMLYHSETLSSFFRRLSFSPDGAILVTPAGVEGDDGAETNTVYVYIRQSLTTSPVFKLQGLAKPATIVAFSPHKYICGQKNMFAEDYAMAFAVATLDAVVVYRTDTMEPVGYVDNLHYLAITDLRWSYDGNRIMVSSTDGFCLVVDLTGVIGEKREKGKEIVEEKGNGMVEEKGNGMVEEKTEEKEKGIDEEKGIGGVEDKEIVEVKDGLQDGKVKVEEKQESKVTDDYKHVEKRTIDNFFRPAK